MAQITTPEIIGEIGIGDIESGAISIGYVDTVEFTGSFTLTDANWTKIEDTDVGRSLSLNLNINGEVAVFLKLSITFGINGYDSITPEPVETRMVINNSNQLEQRGLCVYPNWAENLESFHAEPEDLDLEGVSLTDMNLIINPSSNINIEVEMRNVNSENIVRGQNFNAQLSAIIFKQ